MRGVRLFGAFEVRLADRVLGARDIGGTKPRYLLQILLCERGGSVTKERLADLLWEDALPANVAATLETYVSNVRRVLGGDRSHSPIVTEPGAYRVDPERLPSDLDEFDRLLDSGTRAALEQALALVRGDVLAEEPYVAWAAPLRERYRSLRLETLLRASALAFEDGDHAVAAAHAQTAVDLDPACERAYRAAMTALHAAGRADDATRAFQRCKQALRDELGVDPHPDTLALADAIARRDSPALAPSQPALAPLAAHRTELPLLGRRDELDHFERATRAALAGTPALLLVEGEAGIGKSRLLEELVARLPGVRIARAKCFPLDASIPFAPLAALVRELAPREVLTDAAYPCLGEIIPELEADVAGSEGRRARALESLVAVTRALAPALLVIDDLQWADASTITGLDYLRRRGGDAGIAILGSFRSEDVGPDHPIRQLGAVLHVELPPLSAADLADFGGEPLRARTGGNPLYVVECLRAHAPATGGASSGLAPLILARARAAGAAAHRILAVAAVLGRSFDVESVAGLAGEDPDRVLVELERLCEHRLLRTVGVKFDFRHDVVRETVAASLSPSRRRRLLARAVGVLEQRGADPGELAAHAEEAGDAARALRYSVAAGDAAATRFANTEAAAHLARAVRLAEQQPGLVDEETLERVMLRQARALIPLRRHDEACEIARRVLEAARARGDGARSIDALEVAAMARHFGGSAPADALGFAREALGVAEGIASPAGLARAHALIGGAQLSIGALDDALHHLHEALERAAGADMPPPAFAMGRIGLALHFRARDAEAIAWTRRAEDAATAQRDEASLLMSRWVRALCQQATGHTAEAWSSLASMNEVGCGEESFWQARVPNTYGAFLADLCLHARSVERNQDALERARSRQSGLVKEAEIHTVVNLAADRLALGRLADARADIEWVRRQTCEYARFRWLARMHAVDAEIAVAEGDPERARMAADASLALSEKYGQPKHVARARLAAAAALGALGRVAEARKLARVAASIAADRGYVHLAWRAWHAAGDADRARAAVRRVADGLDDPMRADFLRAVPVAP